MSGVAPGLVVFISIIVAAAVVAIAAAIYKVSSNRGQQDPESQDGMLPSIGQHQADYMRDVRMRTQLQAWGVAPAYEDDYLPPRSHVGRSASVGGITGTSWG